MKLNKAILSGFILTLSFPPLPFYYLAFFAFIPLLSILEKSATDKQVKNLFLNLYLCFFVYHVGSNWWISSFQDETDPFLMASGFAMDIAHPLFFLIPTYIYYRIRLRFSYNISIFLFPFIWAGWEYFHSLGEFSYPWLAIGNTQIYNTYWIQFIDITGIFGASFLIASFNAILFHFLRNINIKAYLTKPGLNLKWLLLLLFLVLIPLFYGYKAEKKYSDINVKTQEVTIGIIQPNKYPWAKWDGGSINQVETMMMLTDSIQSISEDIDLFLWPETSILSIPRNGFNTGENMGFLGRWVDYNNYSLLSGFVHRYEYDEGEKRQVTSRQYSDFSGWYEHFNSSIMLNPKGKPQIYHKMKLTPFAERVPNVEYLTFLKDFIKWGVGISTWGIGLEQKTLKMADSTELASIICIESIYPNFCRNFANMGAEFFTIITNDSWYDFTPGPEQHFIIARMRAIENRRYIARSANSGVSGFIDAFGDEFNRMNQYIRGATVGRIKKISEKSFYTRNGDIFVKVITLVALVFWLFSFLKKRKIN